MSKCVSSVGPPSPIVLAFAGLLASCAAPRSRPADAPASTVSTQTLAPPTAPVRPVVDTYFGVAITDPYRWMETPGSTELDAFLHAEDGYARSILGRPRGKPALLT